MVATWSVEAEVNNGGYDQFFVNSSAQLAEEAVKGFELFELTEYANLTRRAIGVHENKATSDEEKAEQFEPIDKQFFALGDKLRIARVKNIRAKPRLFTGS